MKTNLPFRREFSAGGVVYKMPETRSQTPETRYQKPEILLGKHSGYHKWVLPKGLIEKGERGWQTAIRETEEEMGVKAKLVSDKPIHRETYFYVADFKKPLSEETIQFAQVRKRDQSTRRVVTYQEEGGGKTKVFKTVTFYLMEYVSGDPADHGWEMSQAGWFEYNEALKILAFEGEKEALRKAKATLDKI